MDAIDTGCVVCQNVPVTGVDGIDAIETGCVACQNVPDTGCVTWKNVPETGTGEARNWVSVSPVPPAPLDPDATRSRSENFVDRPYAVMVPLPNDETRDRNIVSAAILQWYRPLAVAVVTNVLGAFALTHAPVFQLAPVTLSSNVIVAVPVIVTSTDKVVK